MKKFVCASAAAVALVGASVAPSAATTIAADNTAGTATAIVLGTSDLEDFSAPASTSTTTDYYFQPTFTGSVALSTSTEDVAGTMAGINPFTISLDDVTKGTVVSMGQSTVSSNGNTESASLSNIGLPFSGDVYELIVTADNTTVNPLTVSGNVFLAPAPLPGTLPLFASGILGFWAWRKRKNGTQATA